VIHLDTLPQTKRERVSMLKVGFATPDSTSMPVTSRG